MGWLIAAAVLLLLFLGFCVLTAARLVYPIRPTFEKTLEIETQKDYVRDYDPQKTTEYTVHAFDGYELHAELLPAPKKTNRYVILSHGYSYDRHGSLKYTHLFRALGFHCVIYDSRGHGRNKKAACTFGVRESRDLCALIDDAYVRFGSDIVLGLHGESMGAALGNIALGRHPNVRFAVHDCSYAAFFPIVKSQLRANHFPAFLAYPIEWMCRLFFRASICAARPADALKANEIPLCIIHGEADKLIPPSHAKQLQQANRGECELHLFPNAPHAGCFKQDEERYRSILASFLERIDILKEEENI